MIDINIIKNTYCQMHNRETSVKDAKEWVNTYLNCKEDTDTAIELLETDFIKTNFKNADEVVRWFVENYYMWGDIKSQPISTNDYVPQKDPSYYRAFVAKENDNIINLRVSRHFSIEKTIKDEYKNDVIKPDIEHHLVVDPKPIVYRKYSPITSDCKILDIWIIVDEWLFSAMKSDKDKRDIVFKLIYILTFGEGEHSNKKNESFDCDFKQHVLSYKNFVQTINS